MDAVVREWYDKAMYLFPEYVPTSIKNLIDSWVGENYIDMLFNDGFKIKIIVDANIIFSEVISYFKKGKSDFLRILDHEVIEAISPTYILEEIEEHMEDIVRKTKKTEEEIWKVIEEKYISKIKLKEVNSRGKRGYEEIVNRLKERDPDDLPYLIMYISEDADAILSRDNHFIGLSGVFTMEMVSSLKKVLYDVERGNLALLITADVLPRLAIYLGRIIITSIFAVMKAFYDFAVEAMEVLKNGIKGFIGWFSNLTPEGKFVGMLFSLISGKIIYDNRKWIKENIVNPIRDFICELIDALIRFFRGVGELLRYLTFAAVEIVELMLNNIQKCIEIYEELGRRFRMMEGV